MDTDSITLIIRTPWVLSNSTGNMSLVVWIEGTHSRGQYTESFLVERKSKLPER